MKIPSIEIYTDGSCHTQYCIGGWAAILFIEKEKIILTGKATDTTHNCMELLAVIKAIAYSREKYPLIDAFHVVSDSQYVIGLVRREEKFTTLVFKTKKGNKIRNADLVKQLLVFTTSLRIQFTKIKAHQKKTAVINYNIEADVLSRKIVRDAVNEIIITPL